MLLRHASAPLAALLARQRSAVLAMATQAGGAPIMQPNPPQHQQRGAAMAAAAASTSTASATTAVAAPATATSPQPPPPSPTAHLNPEQLAAALSPARAVRVIAGPGSGKTATLTARCAALVQGTAGGAAAAGGDPTSPAERVPPWRLLVITFTNKAAGELKKRLADSLGEEAARQVAAGTFHSLAARLLRRYATRLSEAAAADASSSPSSPPPRWASLRPDFTVYDEADATDVLERALKALPPDPGRPKTAELRWQISQVKSHCPQGGYASRGQEAVARAVGASLPLSRALSLGAAANGSSSGSSGLDPDPRAVERLAEAYDAYGAALDADGALDFDDLLGAAVALLERAPGVRAELHRRWRHVLVDEFQDTNAAQYHLVRLLLSPHPEARLFCVGDPCQGVYSFRGADPRNLAAAFERDFGGGGGAAGGGAGGDGAATAFLGQGQATAAGVATMALRRNHRSVDPIVRAAERVLCGCGLAPGLHAAAETVRGPPSPPRAQPPPPSPLAPAPPPNLAPGERYRVPIDEFDNSASQIPSTPSFTAAPVTLVEAATGAGEVAAVVAAARRWRDAGESLGEFAVLYRYRAQARDLEEALAEAGVPCVVHGGTALWARREVRDALAMLRLAARAGGGGGGGGDAADQQQQLAGDSQALRRLLTGIEGLALTSGLGPKAVAALQQAADDAGVSLAALVLGGCCESKGEGGGDGNATSLARLLWDDLARASEANDSASAAAPPQLLDAADISARLERAAPPPPEAVAAALRTAPQRAAIARVRGLVAVVRAALEEEKRDLGDSPFPLAPDEAIDLALHAAGYHAWLSALREKERRAAAAAAGGSAASSSSSSNNNSNSRERSLSVLATLARNPETYEQAAEQELFFLGEEEDRGSSSSPLPPWEEDGDHDDDDDERATPRPPASTPPAVPRGLPGLVAFVDFAALMSDPHNDTPDDDGEEEEEEGDEAAQPRGDGSRPQRRSQRRRGTATTSTDSSNRRRRERDAVQLMTLHASKGREFAHVAMVAVEEGTLPALPPGDALPLRAGEDAWEEEKRLCYVGMTRARDYLMVSWARSRRAWGADGARLLRAAAAAAAAADDGDGGSSGAGSFRPPRNPYAGGGGLVPVERSPFVVALLQGVKSGALKGVDVVKAPYASEKAGGGGGGGGGSSGAKKWGGGSSGRRDWKKKRPQQQQKRGMSSSAAAAATPSSPRSSPPPLPPKPGVGADADALPPPRRSARLRQRRDAEGQQ